MRRMTRVVSARVVFNLVTCDFVRWASTLPLCWEKTEMVIGQVTCIGDSETWLRTSQTSGSNVMPSRCWAAPPPRSASRQNNGDVRKEDTTAYNHRNLALMIETQRKSGDIHSMKRKQV